MNTKTVNYRMTVVIDGQDHLTFQPPNKLQWVNDGANSPGDMNIYVSFTNSNGTLPDEPAGFDWTPTWIGGSPSASTSNTFEFAPPEGCQNGIDYSMPVPNDRQDVSYSLRQNVGRSHYDEGGRQMPGENNHYTLKFYINDGPPGSDTYQWDFTCTVTPKVPPG